MLRRSFFVLSMLAACIAASGAEVEGDKIIGTWETESLRIEFRKDKDGAYSSRVATVSGEMARKAPAAERIGAPGSDYIVGLRYDRDARMYRGGAAVVRFAGMTNRIACEAMLEGDDELVFLMRSFVSSKPMAWRRVAEGGRR
jgi:hypothetical protein